MKRLPRQPGWGRKGAIRGAGVQGRERVRQESRVGACRSEGVQGGDKIRGTRVAIVTGDNRSDS